MATYTYKENKDGFTYYIDDETGKVHHAVNYNSENVVTLYPYKPSKYGGWDNCSNEYTYKYIREKERNGTVIWR